MSQTPNEELQHTFGEIRRPILALIGVLTPLVAATVLWLAFEWIGFGRVDPDYFTTLAQVVPVFALAAAGEAIAIALKPPVEAGPGEEGDLLALIWTSIIVTQVAAMICVATGTDSLFLATVLGGLGLEITAVVASLAFYRMEYRSDRPVDLAVQVVDAASDAVTPKEVADTLRRGGMRISDRRVEHALRFAASVRGGSRILVTHRGYARRDSN